MPPTKLAHVVFQTNRMKEMRDWYCAVLGGRVVYEDGHLSFVTYDDEHHRVAFVDFGPLTPREEGAGLLQIRPSDRPGLHHVAFTFGSMGELLDNYVRLRALDIRPFFCVNHGPTTSMYYTDPMATGWSCRSTTSPRPRKVRRGCCRPRSPRTRSAWSTTRTRWWRDSGPACRSPSWSSATRSEEGAMPRVTGLGHVGIYVRDLTRMVAFYRDVMGMQVTKQNWRAGVVFLSANPERSITRSR